MQHNVGSLDRALRVLAAIGMAVLAVMLPLPLAARIAGPGLTAAYLAWSALASHCVGYRLLGRSTACGVR